ncbi:hypothetical protein [Caulobacter sp. BP25]|uniref:hypothetical protein n=1 Tax=Caulobacter sp. BP25 TaxID=2048900 RepID=UPI000C12A0AC|nr:hypothetical protein [Caulobacter sp. BP25]PHY21762.1 hypothetical protein CSW59_03615 [Caulobacter sp. BP25]
MAFSKTPKPPRTGQGALGLAGEEQAVAFSVLFVDGQGAKKGGKGSIVAETDLLRRAFRAGECRLTLDDGVVLRVAVIAHSEGGDTAYFELR